MSSFKKWSRQFWVPRHTSYRVYYDEWGEIDQEQWDKIWRKHHELFEEMEKFMETRHTPKGKNPFYNPPSDPKSYDLPKGYEQVNDLVSYDSATNTSVTNPPKGEANT